MTVVTTNYRAVIFDLGGVVFPSPFEAFDAYDRRRRARARHRPRAHQDEQRDRRVGRARARRADDDRLLRRARGRRRRRPGSRSTRARLMGDDREPASGRGRRWRARSTRIREAGLRTAALTNNWPRPDDGAPVDRTANTLGFDVVIESAVVGLRKPDPRIYELVLTQLEVEATDAVFLDDLGINLKPARAMGMTTIKVADPDQRARRARGHARIRGALMELLWVRHGEPERIAPGRGVPADPALTAARPRAGAAPRRLARVRDDRRGRVEPAAPRGRDRGADRGRARPRGRDRRRPDRVRLELRPLHPDGGARGHEGRALARDGRRSVGVVRRAIRPRCSARASAPTVDDLVERFAGKRVVAVCHGGVVNVALGLVLGIDAAAVVRARLLVAAPGEGVARRHQVDREPQRARAPQARRSP